MFVDDILIMATFPKCIFYITRYSIKNKKVLCSKNFEKHYLFCCSLSFAGYISKLKVLRSSRNTHPLLFYFSMLQAFHPDYYVLCSLPHILTPLIDFTDDSFSLLSLFFSAGPRPGDMNWSCGWIPGWQDGRRPGPWETLKGGLAVAGRAGCGGGGVVCLRPPVCPRRPPAPAATRRLQFLFLLWLLFLSKIAMIREDRPETLKPRLSSGLSYWVYSFKKPMRHLLCAGRWRTRHRRGLAGSSRSSLVADEDGARGRDDGGESPRAAHSTAADPGCQPPPSACKGVIHRPSAHLKFNMCQWIQEKRFLKQQKKKFKCHLVFTYKLQLTYLNCGNRQYEMRKGNVRNEKKKIYWALWVICTLFLQFFCLLAL